MVHKTASPLSGHTWMVFELPASLWAAQVYLVGDFNHWCPTATPLHRTRDGVWRVSVPLPVRRRYEYRYLIDDSWKTDYLADGLVPNPYGTVNSVVCTTLSAGSSLA